MFILSKLIDKRIAAYQAHLTHVHYAEVENMYNQMRIYAHDFNNHIQTLRLLAKGGHIEDVVSYLDGLDDSLAHITPILRTGNRMCDAVLNSKISLARSSEINVAAECYIPMEINIPALDLCIILGNLMDNAIEANLALAPAGRFIRIFMEPKSQSSQIYISITNATALSKQKKAQGRYKTTKGKGHGFGLISIDNIIGRYGGFLSRNSEDGAYVTEILLPNTCIDYL